MSTDVLAPSSEDAPSREAPTKPRPTHPLFGLLAAVVVGVVILLLAYTGAVDAYQTFQLATSAAIFCAAAGLTVMTGLSGQISVGHGAIMAVGAYTAALMMERLTEAGTSPLLALVCSLIGAIVVSLIIGAIIGAAAARQIGRAHV